MPWMRHKLRDAQVWAEVDLRGRLVSDEAGRVQVVYKREPGAKLYRAGARNLGPVAGAPIEPDLPAAGVAGASPGAKAGSANRAAEAGATMRGGSGAAGGSAAGGARGGRTARLGKTLKLTDPLPADAIHVWTDGACTGNPGPAGLGVVVLDGETRREHREYLGHGTNNIAELTAVLRGLDMLDRTDRPVLVYTDSSYSIGVLSLGWKAKANVELVAEIKDRIGAFDDVRFVKVPGHAGVIENERCDALARAAISARR
jgi:ribonuclease HI